jgi:hypothetical protein
MRGVDVGAEVVVADLVLVAEAADVIGDVSPGAQAVDLGALEEEELLVGAPVAVEDGEGVLLYYAVGVGLGAVGAAGLAVGEALDADVVVGAGAVRASDADLLGYMRLVGGLG